MFNMQIDDDNTDVEKGVLTPTYKESDTAEKHNVCRLCSSEGEEALIMPCECPDGFVHRHCLNRERCQQQFEYSQMSRCKRCDCEYQVRCKPDTAWESFREIVMGVRVFLLRKPWALHAAVQSGPVATCIFLSTALRLQVGTGIKEIFLYYSAAVLIFTFSMWLGLRLHSFDSGDRETQDTNPHSSNSFCDLDRDHSDSGCCGIVSVLHVVQKFFADATARWSSVLDLGDEGDEELDDPEETEGGCSECRLFGCACSCVTLATVSIRDRLMAGCLDKGLLKNVLLIAVLSGVDVTALVFLQLMSRKFLCLLCLRDVARKYEVLDIGGREAKRSKPAEMAAAMKRMKQEMHRIPVFSSAKITAASSAAASEFSD